MLAIQQEAGRTCLCCQMGMKRCMQDELDMDDSYADDIEERSRTRNIWRVSTIFRTRARTRDPRSSSRSRRSNQGIHHSIEEDAYSAATRDGKYFFALESEALMFLEALSTFLKNVSESDPSFNFNSRNNL